MALRAVTDHPKFFRLKLLLKLNKSCALGYLEALWHFCGKYTPQGNIGKYTDADIEAWLEWDGEEGALVAACVKAGWLREHQAHRLIVHDWSQYADEIVHTDLARKCLRFADGLLPKTGRLNKHERARYLQAFPEAKDTHAPASPEDGHSASQTDSDMGQTKSDLGTKPEPEPEPEPAIQPTPLPPASGGRECEAADSGEHVPRETKRSTALHAAGTRSARDVPDAGGVGLTAEEFEELAEVNAIRARRTPPEPPWPAEQWARMRVQEARIANPTDPMPVRSRRRRWQRQQ